MATLIISPNNILNEFKIAAGEAALDGSNPTPLALPFPAANLVALILTPKVSVGSGSIDLTYAVSGGVVNVYGWIAAGTASAGTETFGYIAIGY
jgi:hypothetical protein